MKKPVLVVLVFLVLALMMGVAAANGTQPVKKPAHAKGVVISVDTSEGIVRWAAKGRELEFKVNDLTRIKKDGRKVALAALAGGDKGFVKYLKTESEGLKALKIYVKTPVMHGELREVGASSVVVAGRETTRTFEVNSETLIRKDGEPAALADLAIGDHLKIKYTKLADGSLLAIKIKASGPAEE